MADYDDPRPSSQEVGTTEQVVAKDNLITFDKFVNGSVSETVTNRKGDELTTLTKASSDINTAISEIVEAAEQEIQDLIDGEITLTLANSATSTPTSFVDGTFTYSFSGFPSAISSYYVYSPEGVFTTQMLIPDIDYTYDETSSTTTEIVLSSSWSGGYIIAKSLDPTGSVTTSYEKVLPSTSNLVNAYSDSSSEVGSIVRTLGYSSKGDGGGATWIKTGSSSGNSNMPTENMDGTLTSKDGSVYELLPLGGFINILSLGADGSGSDDSYLSIQTAINFAVSKDSPMRVHAPAGEYSISGTITCTDAITLTGDGHNNTSFITASGYDGYEFTVSSGAARPIEIRDIGLLTEDNTNSYVGLNINADGQTGLGYKLLMDRVRIAGSATNKAWLTALYLFECGSVRINDYYIVGRSGSYNHYDLNGIWATDSTDIVLTNGKIYWVGNAIIADGFSEGWIVTGHHIVPTQYGVTVDTGGNLFNIKDNHISADGYGIKFAGDSSSRPNHSTIKSNLIFRRENSDSDYKGIYLEATRRAKVIGNEVLQVDSDGDFPDVGAGIYCGDDALDVSLTSNVLSAMPVGIQTTGNESIIGSDNIYSSCTIDGDYGDSGIQVGQKDFAEESKLPTPDFKVSFKNGVDIDHGFGSATFSRTGAATYINKSGTVSYLAGSTPNISKFGFISHSAYTGYLTSISSDMNSSGDSDYNLTSSLSPDRSTYWGYLSNAENGYLNIYQNSNFSDSEYVTFSVFAKRDSGQIRLRFFSNFSTNDQGGSSVTFDTDDIDTVTASDDLVDYGYEDYGDYYRLYIISQYLDANSDDNYGVTRLQTNGSDNSAYIWGVNVTKSSELVPYRSMSAGSDSVGECELYYQVENNLPNTRDSWFASFSLRAGVSPDHNKPILVISGDSSSGNFDGIYLTTANSIRFSSGSNGAGAVSLGTISNNDSYNEESNRITVIYDGDNEVAYCYVNGEMNAAGEQDVSGMTMPYDGNMLIGTDGSNHLQSGISDLEIYHFKPSTAQISALGNK